jgi:putative flavoprotein involved in K+ transport
MDTSTERFETVVVGGGQAGLAVGYHLTQGGRSFVILDASARSGDAWRARWDSLRLFTPARYTGLPGSPFPGSKWAAPAKDEMADYLEAYAVRHDLPVRSGVKVERLGRADSADGAGGRFVVGAGERRFEAANVVVATGGYDAPNIPEFAPELDPALMQLHSTEYRRPSQVPEGDVLVVGAGNSGAEIALELSAEHRVLLSGRYPGVEPTRTGSAIDRLATPPFWFFLNHVLHVGNPIGRSARRKMMGHGIPLARVKPRDLAAAGVEHVPRTVGVDDGAPALEDGRVVDVRTVVWCTGFRPDFGWIDLPILDEAGHPMHRRGVVESVPGLYFIGLFFLVSAGSSLVGGVGSDAEFIARHIMSAGRSESVGDGRPLGLAGAKGTSRQA